MNHQKTYKKGLSKRNLPLNIKASDLYLFEHELVKEYPDTEIKILQKVNINYYGYIFKGLIINPFSFRGSKIPSNFLLFNKLKFFFKNNSIVRKSISVNRAIWFTDTWSLAYFHWLTDAIPRLYLMLEKIRSGEKILLSSRYLEFDYVLSSLKLLGIKKGQIISIHPNCLVIINHLYLPLETSYSTGNYHDKLFSSLRNFIHKKFTELDLKFSSDRIERIYISRNQNKRRKIINEQEILSVLKKYNFEFIDFEALSWIEQVFLCFHSKIMMSVHGAALTNMIFMKSGGSIVELRRKGDSHNNCYFSLASTCKHAYIYLECKKHNAVNKKVGDYYVEESDVIVDISKLDRLLNEYIV